MPKIPAWKQRLHQLHLNPPHYEASWYGPIDKLANQVFAADCFMVKPQPKIRPSAPPGDADGELLVEEEGLSTDSMGTPVLPTSYFELDFVIVLVDDARDIPLVCIEVKKEGESHKSAGSQLYYYIEALTSKDPHDEFVAMLVLGGKFYCYSASGRRARTAGGEGWETAEDLEGIFEKVVKGVLGGKGKRRR
ncbi:uncharacterized protein BJ212DRAFT_1390878 [Suillus subaureus]|uniref:Uncharacterized protein n=1 Tax=Suillus subaureus TaxID=48587 RepID=A0A9P7J6W3_9AGAM|nr:uncharacterized protein BJ212DRAFT_1390878 [Suillus subaureus]KAG1805666.1 hypothetical protein BJ212DRAFT_1390878 [Suillus subaureus]